MALSRFFHHNDPFLTFRQFNRVFDDALRGRGVPAALWATTDHASFRPRLDLQDGPDNTMKATFELPGLTKDDVNIELHRDRLVISGERKSESEQNSDENYVVRERSYGRFEQTLVVPEGTEAEKINASVENGILTVTFPKTSTTPEATPKKITIS